ncbi:LOW QUALITY PROTEIN: hypothetical protein HID58_072499, partial [Brassica napus]
SARKRACRRRSPSSNRKDVGISLLFRLLCPLSCLSSGSGPIHGGSASGVKARSCGGAVKLVVLPVDVSFPGGGGSFSSVTAGPCLREVEASSALSSSVFSPGGEGSLSLASPALGFVGSVLVPTCGLCVVLGSWFQVVHGFVQSDEFSIGSMKLSEVKTKRGSEEIVGGGVAPAMSRDGDGQVEAEATRVVLMVFYPYTCPASLTRGPTEVVQGFGLLEVCFVGPLTV